MAERPIDELKIKISVDESGDVSKSLQDIIDKLEKVKEAGGGKSQQFTDLLTTLSNIDKSLSKISTSLTRVSSSISKIATMTQSWSGKFANELNNIDRGMQNISDAASKSAKGFSDVTKESIAAEKALNNIKIESYFDDSSIKNVTESLEETQSILSAVTENASDFATSFEETRGIEAPYKQYDTEAIIAQMEAYAAATNKAVTEQERLSAIDLSKQYTKVDLLKEKYNELADKLAVIVREDNFGGKNFANLIAQMQKIQAEIDRITAAETRLNGGAAFERMGVAAWNAAKRFVGVHINLKGIVSTLGKIYTFPFSGIAKQISGIGQRLKGLLKSFARTARMRAFRYAIRAVVSGIKEGIDNAYEWARVMDTRVPNFAESMDRVSTATLYLKNSLGALATPIINAIAPAFDFLIDKVVEFINIINQMIARLTGATMWTRAVRYAKEYKEAVSGAAASAGKLAEELITILGIDEINPMAADKGEGGGSGGGSGNDLDYSSMFVNEQLTDTSDKLSELFDPLKKAWDEKGAGVMSSINFALSSIKSLTSSLKNSFWTVWTNETGEETITRILGIFTGINTAIGNIATALETGWNTDNLGTQTIQNLWNTFNGILKTIENIVNTTADWAKDLDFSGIMKALEELTKAFDEFMKPVNEFVEKVWEKAILPFAKWVIEDIAPVALDLIAEAFGAITEAWELVSPVFYWLWDNILSPSLGTVGTAVTDALELVRDMLAAIKGFLQDINDLINGNKTLKEFLEGGPKTTPQPTTPERISKKEGWQSVGESNNPSAAVDNLGQYIYDKFRNNPVTITANVEGNKYSQKFDDPTTMTNVRGNRYSQKFDDPVTNTTAKATKLENGIPKGKGIIADIIASANALETIAIPAKQKVVGGMSGDISKVKDGIPSDKKYLPGFLAGLVSPKDMIAQKDKVVGGMTAKLSSKNETFSKTTGAMTAYLAKKQDAIPTNQKTISGFTSILGGWTKNFSTQKIGGWTSILEAWARGYTGDSKSQKIYGWTSMLEAWARSYTGDSKSQKIYGWTSMLQYFVDSITSTKGVYDVTAYVNKLEKGDSFTGLNISGQVNNKNGTVSVALKKRGGIFSSGFWKSVPQYASGTLNAGSLFIAGESGAELVGNVNGRTEVLNRSQIASAMEASVISGNAQQNRLLQEQNQLLRELINKQGNARAYVTSGDIIDGLQQRNRRDGRTVVAIGV